LFDEHGRRIPPALKSAVYRESRRYFRINQPEIDYASIHARLKKHLGAGEATPAKEFERRAQGILQRLGSDARNQHLSNGVRVPFILPKARYADIGEALEEYYLPALLGSYKAKFPQYDFVSHHKAGLAGKLSVAPGSRHERLLEAMQQAEVVGFYFPCLLEYSVPAALEQMAALPEHFLLAGGFDTSAALIGSPELLLRTDGYPPLLWLSALTAEKDGVGYHYEAYGYNLTFNRRPHLGKAAEYWTSGLVVLG
jgi:hypothetical protein